MSARQPTLSVHGEWLRASDWTVPDPLSDKLSEASWAARYFTGSITKEHLAMLAAAADAYCHFASYDLGNQTESVIDQLRQVRASVRKRMRP